MRTTAYLIAALSLLAATALAAAESKSCLGCHDSGADASIHDVLESAHGDLDQACEACHGPSTDHASRPTVAPPDISFGPRWTATTAEQDGQCLNCHSDNVGAHWQDALHMANNISCVGCHDTHTQEDPALNPRTQAQVCTVCHKTQQRGIHGKEKMVRMNPPCTQCHNPHADQRPKGVMLENGSQGCRRCHNMKAMANNEKVSNRAKSFHRVMDNPDRTCIDCHKGVAHGAFDAVEPFMPLAVSRRPVTLFYPGQSDSTWILTGHRGSQPLRQGTNCQQCHRGEEAKMGAALSEEEPSSRDVEVSFLAEDDRLITELSWQGSADDTGIAFMWGYGVDEEFRRGGCFAACHADMPGMSRDRGVGLDKYLRVSRSQLQQVGQPALVKPAPALEELIASGDFVEQWRIDLRKGGSLKVGAVLAKVEWLDSDQLSASANFKDGSWKVRVQRPLRPDAPLKPVVPGTRYTFGIALHSKDRPGAEHWVSLPMSLDLEGTESDFRAD